MKITFLGVSGWIPGQNETACVMVETSNTLFLLDAGTGISNLLQYNEVLSRYNVVCILLSHYHLDHVIGLAYLLPYIHNKNLIIYGPGIPYYKYSAQHYIRALFREEFFSVKIDDFSKNVTICDYPSTCFCINDTNVSIRVQKHSAPSVRISLDDKVIYATDTVLESDEWKNIKSTILLHECWEINESETMHTALPNLMRELPIDNFNQIYLIHQNPFWSIDDRKAISDTIRGTKLILPNDNMTVII